MSILKVGMYASQIPTDPIPTEQNYLTFSSDNPFSIKFSQKSWDGVLEYSTDTQNWTEWDASEIYSVDNALYIRGTGNSYITGIDAFDNPPNYAVQINATSGVTCSGNIMTLLDHVNPDTVVMGEAAFACMFFECTSLTVAPELPATVLADVCYSGMFYNCTSLIDAPELPATMLAERCYEVMFFGCTGIKISSTQTGIYQIPWRIPTVGTGIPATDWSNAMIWQTGGTFTDDPEINTTYFQADIGGEFRYVLEIGEGEYGEFAFYGASVAGNEFREPFGTFIENIENDKLGEMLVIEWGFMEGEEHYIRFICRETYYLGFYHNGNIRLILSDQNGEIIRITIPPENVSYLAPTGDVATAAAGNFTLTEEQFNLLPKSGRVFVDIVL